ncbi:hypothetical protein [Clostridium sp. JN-1]|uniref:hypothetical protein n=1 Tax=Clostridium sp. JN-1 TaxID=2483110 RepID=UPI000F0B7A06|nr:hypothetical protein [Clostridium sp. JN-1]
MSVNAADIRIETTAPQPAINNGTIVRFFPNANDASTAFLVEVSGKSEGNNKDTIISLCEIENIQSEALIDTSSDFVPDALKALLDKSINPECDCCQEQLRKLFQSKVGTSDNTVFSIDTNNIIQGTNNTIVATGGALALIRLPDKKTGAAVGLCQVSSVTFKSPVTLPY